MSSKIDYHHCYQKRENSTTTTYNGSTAAEVVLCVCSTPASAVAHNFVFSGEGRVTKNAVAPLSDSNKRRVAVTARMVMLFIDGVVMDRMLFIDGVGDGSDDWVERHDVLPSLGSVSLVSKIVTGVSSLKTLKVRLLMKNNRSAFRLPPSAKQQAREAFHHYDVVI